MEFINKHVPKNIAEITHVAIYNKLIITFDAKESINDIDIFNQKNIYVVEARRWRI